MKQLTRSALSTASLALLMSVPAPADDHRGLATAEIQEWKSQEDSRPRDPWLHEGTVWFVGQSGNYVATLNPESGEFKRYEIPEGAHPHTVIVDDRGAWYAGNLDEQYPGSGESGKR